MLNPPCDSPEGIKIIMDFARHGGFVLYEAHERLAKKHGVDTSGVTFSRPIPILKTIKANQDGSRRL
jgi:hypothetical protein